MEMFVTKESPFFLNNHQCQKLSTRLAWNEQTKKKKEGLKSYFSHCKQLLAESLQDISIYTFCSYQCHYYHLLFALCWTQYIEFVFFCFFSEAKFYAFVCVSHSIYPIQIRMLLFPIFRQKNCLNIFIVLTVYCRKGNTFVASALALCRTDSSV